MSGIKIQPGDKVIYQCQDNLTWGPWRLLDINRGVATVSIGSLFTYSLQANLLSKDKSGKVLVLCPRNNLTK